MATTAHPTGFAAAPARAIGIPLFFKRLVNALVASRAMAAEAELRRHEILLRETALVHGPYRLIGLDKADLLPFNV